MLKAWALFQQAATASIARTTTVDASWCRYHTKGDEHGCYYDDDWAELTYFVSSQESAFEIAMLQKFDAELLIGQISYKQKADIFNLVNQDGVPKKQCTTTEVEAPDQDSEQQVR